MQTTCLICQLSYDDADCYTICPHEPLMSLAQREQKKLAISLLGKDLRFHHMTPQNPTYRIISINYEGMVNLDGMAGQFAPNLFIIVE